MQRKSVLIFSKKTLDNSPRIIREIGALKYNYKVYAIGGSKPIDESISYENIYLQRTFLDIILNKINYLLQKLLGGKLVIPKYSKVDGFVQNHNISLLIIHEPDFLPLAISLKKKYGLKIVFNAHEYYPLEFEDDIKWLKTNGVIYNRLYQKYLSQLDLFVNVCQGIYEKCLKEYNVSSIVIPNAAFYSDIPIYNNSDEKIRMIYHGAILESRKIEEMIEVVKMLGVGYELDIMGTSLDFNHKYYKKLQKIIEDIPNVKFKESVKFQNIITTINRYDIGIYILKPNGFNNEYALPNKLFEYMQAKLAIAISPSIEMKRLVNDYNLGIVADNFTNESLANKIKCLTKQNILDFKKNSEIASRYENAEKYNDFFLSHIKKLIG
jgi:glycosyltransferase involved in cell wall biosynthesis